VSQIKNLIMETKTIEQLPNLGSRDTIRSNSTAFGDLVKIALDKIVVRGNFNVRTDMGNLEELADSIIENGQTIPGRVDVLEDGTFALVDGHRRYEAHKIIADRGYETFFIAIVNGKKTTEEQRILQMFTTQDNKPLAVHEVAELISRLVNLGHDQTSVAKKIGKTPSYVSQMLDFANETPEIKNMVKEGVVNVSTVLQVKKDIKDSGERATAIKTAVANNAGKKVTLERITNRMDNKLTAAAEDLINKLKPSEYWTINRVKNILKEHFTNNK
jgi:ParB/RepB/Spo0J family partition protein